MPNEIQLLEQARHLAGQITAADQNAVTIFAALLIADATRDSVSRLTKSSAKKESSSISLKFKT